MCVSLSHAHSHSHSPLPPFTTITTTGTIVLDSSQSTHSPPSTVRSQTTQSSAGVGWTDVFIRRCVRVYIYIYVRIYACRTTLCLCLTLPTLTLSSPSLSYTHKHTHLQAYIEFFTSPENLRVIMDVVRDKPNLNVHAVDSSGNHVYSGAKGVTALTWGVFPNKEILQPTIFDSDTFVVWSEEAFQLWTSAWASLYVHATPVCYRVCVCISLYVY